MGCLGLGGMTVLASLAGRRSAVGLVACVARLVALGCRPVLVLVTVPACFEHAPAVRLVAVVALLVASRGLRVLCAVARAAACQQRFGSMGQTAVAVAALLVPAQGGRLSRGVGVAVRAQLNSTRSQEEAVRLVALAAGHALVELLLVGCCLMTRAAVADERQRLRRRRMRVVATSAGARLAVLGVIGVDVLMAAGAGTR